MDENLLSYLSLRLHIFNILFISISSIQAVYSSFLATLPLKRQIDNLPIKGGSLNQKRLYLTFLFKRTYRQSNYRVSHKVGHIEAPP